MAGMFTPLSIQGEHEAAKAATLWATQDEVNADVEQMNPAHIPCRERGRHIYPSIRESFVLSGIDKDTGLMIRRVVCKTCETVPRVELWDIRHHRGVITRADLVSARTDYSGTDYLAKPGTGRRKPKQIRNALATEALKGQRYRELRKNIMAAVTDSTAKVTPAAKTA